MSTPAPTPEAATHAKFNPLIRPYLVLQVGFALVMTVIGIPLALIWFLDVGNGGRDTILRNLIAIWMRANCVTAKAFS
jgi:hypothetical protein